MNEISIWLVSRHVLKPKDHGIELSRGVEAIQLRMGHERPEELLVDNCLPSHLQRVPRRLAWLP